MWPFAGMRLDAFVLGAYIVAVPLGGPQIPIYKAREG
jgi:hypothetical protein